ncbi:Thylakoidal processing peptidase 1, chloroplastic-like protein [Drosera capensis]
MAVRLTLAISSHAAQSLGGRLNCRRRPRISTNIFPDPNRTHPLAALRSRSASSMMAAMNSLPAAAMGVKWMGPGMTPVATVEDKGGTREKKNDVEKSNWIYKALSLCSDDAKAVFTAVTVSLLYKSSLAEPRLIPTRSMCPTLDKGDRILAEKVLRASLTTFRKWKALNVICRRGVLVTSCFAFNFDRSVSYAFREPESRSNRLQSKIGCSKDAAFVKRIVAKAGDCVEVHHGRLWVNGAVQDEDFILEPLNYEMPPQIIPEGYVYVMGDNRNNSCDSHDWGPLPVECIVGRSILRYWPPSKVVGGPNVAKAVGVWVDRSVKLKAEFREGVERGFGAAAREVDFQNKAVEATSEVNSWAEKETNDLIKEVLPVGSVDHTTRLILANAVYFKGAWDEKFDASKTIMIGWNCSQSAFHD